MTNKELWKRYEAIGEVVNSKVFELINNGYICLATHNIFEVDILNPEKEPDSKMKEHLQTLYNWKLLNGKIAKYYMEEIKKLFDVLIAVKELADDLSKKALINGEKEKRTESLQQAFNSIFDAGDELPECLKDKEKEIRDYCRNEKHT